jgi:protein O-mannosyl-transferase
MSKRKKSYTKRDPRGLSETSIALTLPLSMLAGAAIIVVITFIAYLPSLTGEFMLDDDILLTDNTLIKAPDGLSRFWRTTESPDYWPATNTTLWIEWRLWGNNPVGYHLTNLVLHIVEALLIWIILRKLAIPGAFLAAMLFALHPVNVESVAWISQRKDMMAVLFFLLSILCYLQMDLQRQLHNLFNQIAMNRWYWLSLAFFALAMLSKGSAAILPVLLLGIIWWLRPLSRCDLVRIAPFFLVAVALAGVNVWFQTHGTGAIVRNAGFAERLLGAGCVVWFYLYKALVPVDLALVYPQWHIQTDILLWWLPLAAALIVTAVLWCYRKRWSRPFLFAWGFFCISIAPMMGFIDVGFMKYSLVADHYQHIAIIGIIALATACFSAWHSDARGGTRRVATIVAVAVVGALTLLTWQQGTLYSEKIKLYQVALEKNPACSMLYNNLALDLEKAGRIPEAIELCQRALTLMSDNADAHNNLANALMQVGRIQEAIEHYQRALTLKPDNPDAHNNFAAALSMIGQHQQAIDHYEQALRLKPSNAEAHINMAAALESTGQYSQAIEHYKQALVFKPDNAEAYNYMGVALVNVDQVEKSITCFQKAMRLKPDYTEACTNLARVYARINRLPEAIDTAQRALNMAKSKGQTEQARKIEELLNSCHSMP